MLSFLIEIDIELSPSKFRNGLGLLLFDLALQSTVNTPCFELFDWLLLPCRFTELTSLNAFVLDVLSFIVPPFLFIGNRYARITFTCPINYDFFEENYVQNKLCSHALLIAS